MRNLVLTALYGAGTVVSLTTLIMISVVKSDVASMKLKVNKLAFFNLNNIILTQIPSYQALIFAAYLMFLAYYVWQYIVERRQTKGFVSIDDKRAVEISTKESKLWSNILLTNLFIYMTQGLALLLAIMFCKFAMTEIDYLMSQYENSISQQDVDTMDMLDQKKRPIAATLALNAVCLAQIIAISAEGCFLKVAKK